MPRVGKNTPRRDYLNQVPPELEDMAELVGNFIAYWGFKKIHGRIWTHVYLSATPLDAGVLIHRLRTSKANISTALKELLAHDVIKSGPKSPWNTQTYVANPDLLKVILAVLRRRELKMLSSLDVASGVLNEMPDQEKSGAAMDEERIKTLVKIIQDAKRQLQTVISLGVVDMGEWKGWRQ